MSIEGARKMVGGSVTVMAVVWEVGVERVVEVFICVPLFLPIVLEVELKLPLLVAFLADRFVTVSGCGPASELSLPPFPSPSPSTGLQTISTVTELSNSLL